MDREKIADSGTLFPEFFCYVGSGVCLEGTVSLLIIRRSEIEIWGPIRKLALFGLLFLDYPLIVNSENWPKVSSAFHLSRLQISEF